MLCRPVVAAEQALSAGAGFPRLMAMNIGSKHYDDPDYQNALARFDMAILGFYRGWRGRNGEDIGEAVRRIKQLNPRIKVGQYTILADAFDGQRNTDADFDKFYKLVQEGWWLHDAAGNKVTSTTIYGTSEVNITGWAAPDFNGKRFSEWLAERDHRLFFGQIPEFDIWYMDNVLEHSRVKRADWDLDGKDDEASDPRIAAAYREGNVSHWRRANELSLQRVLMGNVDHGLSAPEYRGRLGGAFLEGLMGKSWSLERHAGWRAMMNTYRQAIANTAAPHWVGFNAWGEPGDYRAFRYALASCLMDDGYFSYTDAVLGYSGVAWFDEYGVRLGQAMEPAQYAPWQRGVYRRLFEHGMVLVNPSDTAIEVMLPPGYRRIEGQQDRAVNDGAVISKQIVPARDGIVLVREAGSAGVIP